MSLKILLLGILVAITQARVETKHHSKFLPMVAMSCGFRNMYTTEKDGWKSDTDRYATCFSGKFDILKYCQKVYPNRNITNIVEYAHDIDILNWCREEGSPCKWTHNVRPYHCIEGDFPSVALQVPEHCRFSHISTSDKCEEYHHWKEEATKQCSAKLGDFGKPMVLHSMAVMETCAIDMFRGVEFVCCNTGSPREDFFRKQQEDSEDEENSESDEEDDDEKDDEDSDSYAEDSDEDEDEIEDQDPYFKAANWTNEHDDFKLAEDRMEQRQRKKIDKVMKQWAQLESRYAQMKKKDPSGAEKFKTVASLEEEHKRMRKDIESVHEERVQALLNEKKRDSTHDYRQALSTHVVKANKHIVLQTLKTYIRTEEKDRMHTLNRYRHLLRTDRQEAELYKNKVLHKLRYIDLRINGTIAMLRDFPDLEKYVRPIAVSYWQDYRRENTPELTDSEIDTLNKLGEEKKNMKLIDYYTQQFEKSHSNDKLKLQAPSTTVTSVIHPADPLIVADKDAKVLPTESKSIDSEENDDDYYEDEQDEQVKKTPGNIKVIEIKPKELTSPKIIKTDTITDDDSESSESSEESTSEDDDDDSEDVESSEKNLKELRVDIEPIIEERAAFARHDRLVQSTSKPFFDGIGIIKSTVFLMAVIGSIYFVAAFAIKSRRANRGFIEVDVYTPEERHVAGMQVNGYENPTYSFFDSKA